MFETDIECNEVSYRTLIQQSKRPMSTDIKIALTLLSILVPLLFYVLWTIL